MSVKQGSLPNGTSGIGFGPQEEFYNCADIEIRSFPGQPGTSSALLFTTKPSYKTTTTRTEIPTKTSRTTKLKSTTKASTMKTTVSTKKINKNPFFHCEKIEASMAAKLPKDHDPNEFNGIPLCLLIGDSPLTCKDCYENCISPYKKCPKESYDDERKLNQ
ncbi:hypothetical protein BpHYR1_038719 [Brachionus plicatilis]|uniref:Uncharacterized protein n=1 Tax=Brachionus plicatilis TaxID=10195 RepID=A0A3M7S9Y9_BRAPC|nr:hypothetical protein BpHYR1_038719 [Brachionus plicatilis]